MFHIESFNTNVGPFSLKASDSFGDRLVIGSSQQFQSSLERHWYAVCNHWPVAPSPLVSSEPRVIHQSPVIFEILKHYEMFEWWTVTLSR